MPDDKTAAIIGPLAFALMSLFGGFFLNIDSLPFFLSWLQVRAHEPASLARGRVVCLSHTTAFVDTVLLALRVACKLQRQGSRALVIAMQPLNESLSHSYTLSFTVFAQSHAPRDITMCMIF